MISASHPSPFPRKTNPLGGGGWGICFLGGARLGGKAAWRHTPWVPDVEVSLAVSLFPATQPPLPRASSLHFYCGKAEQGGCLPAGSTSPFQEMPPFTTPTPISRYLKETERKVVLLWFPSGRGSLGSRTESWRPAEPPFSDEKLLVGVFRIQVIEPLLWALGWGTKPPPAASRAPRLHSVICGFASRQPPRPESPSRRVGQTMELWAGPAGTARPHRERADRLAVNGAETGRRSGELTT